MAEPFIRKAGFWGDAINGLLLRHPYRTYSQDSALLSPKQEAGADSTPEPVHNEAPTNSRENEATTNSESDGILGGFATAPSQSASKKDDLSTAEEAGGQQTVEATEVAPAPPWAWRYKEAATAATAESTFAFEQLRAGQDKRAADRVSTGSRYPSEEVDSHIAHAILALDDLDSQSAILSGWGVELAQRLLSGQRLLAAGNGGSAAAAQHLTAAMLGRFDDERIPFAAVALHADSSALTAISNDYGYEEVFARQVRAQGRAGDVLVLLSASGKSPNLLRAAESARRVGVTTWALTGPAPNPLAAACDESICIDAAPANAQEMHLVAIHAIGRVFDAYLRNQRASDAAQPAEARVARRGGLI